MTSGKLEPGRPHWTVWDISERATDLQGQAVPSWFNARLVHPDWPVEALLTVDVDPERGPIPTGLQVWRNDTEDVADPPSYRELDNLLAASVDMARLLRECTADAAGEAHARRLREHLSISDMDMDELRATARGIGEEMRATAERARGVTQPRRRRIVSRQHLVEVAATYRDALANGSPPTQHVAERFRSSHSTASRWVRMAREAGVLGAATGTRPGEATSS